MEELRLDAAEVSLGEPDVIEPQRMLVVRALLRRQPPIGVDQWIVPERFSEQRSSARAKDSSGFGICALESEMEDNSCAANKLERVIGEFQLFRVHLAVLKWNF